MSIRPDRFLNAIYTWAIERIPADKMEQWLFQLKQPLPGRESKQTDLTIEDEGASFMAAMSAFRGA